MKTRPPGRLLFRHGHPERRAHGFERAPGRLIGPVDLRFAAMHVLLRFTGMAGQPVTGGVGLHGAFAGRGQDRKAKLLAQHLLDHAAHLASMKKVLIAATMVYFLCGTVWVIQRERRR